MEKVPTGQGPLENLGRAMIAMAAHIDVKSGGDSAFICPNLPRLPWSGTFICNHIFNKEYPGILPGTLLVFESVRRELVPHSGNAMARTECG